MLDGDIDDLVGEIHVEFEYGGGHSTEIEGFLGCNFWLHLRVELQSF